MATLSVQDASAGAAVTFTAASAGGDTVPSGSRAAGWTLGVVLLVKNGDVAAHTVTVGSLPAVSVPAAGQAVIPVVAGTWATPVSVTYDAVTSMTVAAVKLAPGV